MEQKGEGEARISGEVFHGPGETVVAAGPERGDQRRAQQRQHAGGIGIAEAAAVFKAHGIPQPMDVILHRPVPADELSAKAPDEPREQPRVFLLLLDEKRERLAVIGIVAIRAALTISCVSLVCGQWIDTMSEMRSNVSTLACQLAPSSSSRAAGSRLRLW